MGQPTSNINQQLIRQIFCQIVKDYPKSPVCQQINTFTTYRDPSDYNNPGFNKNYDDYLKGSFWSRDWHAAGADPAEIKAGYPVLHLERRRTLHGDYKKANRCYDYWVVVSDIYNCQDCGDCKRIYEEVKEDVEAALENVMREFLQYKEYNVVAGEEQYLTWATPGRMQAWEAADRIDSYNETGQSIEDNIEIAEGNSGEWGRGISVNNLVGWGINFRICGCREVRTDFNYDEQQIKELATSTCLTCR